MVNEYSYKLPVLETERLLLLPWKLEYAKDMLLLQCEINRDEWVFYSPTPDIKKAKSAINNYLKHGYEEWAIALKNENGFNIIGQIGLRTRTAYKEFNFYKEISWYRIANEYQGMGYCTEAVKKILHFAFIGLNCDGMYVYHDYFNGISKKVIEKCGFKYKTMHPKPKKGEFPKPTARCSYTMTREAFLALNSIADTENERVKHYPDLKVNVVQISGRLHKVKNSPYSFKNPIRKIDEIKLVHASDGNLSGYACVAMLAGITLEDVVKLAKRTNGLGKKDIEILCEYYGIRFMKRDENTNANNDIRLIRVGEPWYWAVYYNGICYDPFKHTIYEYTTNKNDVWRINP